MKQAERKYLLAACFMLVSWLAYPPTLKLEETYFPKRRLTFNRIHGVTP
jgi:hypothetical protein